MTRKGFTLIELLVVVAVLALLASIVFSNLGGAREGARISNALSFQSQTHSLLGSDLVGWWNFNGNLNDLSGYGNNASWQGGGNPNFVDGIPGTGGNALEFNGSSNSVTIPDAPVFDLENDFTLSVWVYWDSHKNYGSVLHKGSGGTSDSFNYAFFMYNDLLRFYIGDGSSSQSTAVSTTSGHIDTEKWHHLVGKRDSSSIAIYVNGIERSSTPRTINQAANSNDLSLVHSSYVIDGRIDDVRIYSRALTASEVQGLYAQTKGKYLANE